MLQTVFEAKLSSVFENAAANGARSVTVNSGELHRAVGGYPNKDHRMPTCCKVMVAAKAPGDRVISIPPKGKGASLTIEYALPR